MRTRSPLLLPGLFLATACAAPTAGPDASEEIRPPIDWSALRTRALWFGVYLDGRKAGHSHTAAGLVMHDDERVFVRRARFVLDAGTVETLTTVEEVYDAAPPYRLRHSRSTTRQGEGSTALEMQRHGDELEVVYRSNDREAVRRRMRVDHDLRDVLALESWIRRDPEPGTKVTVRVLNADSLTVERQPIRLVARRAGIVQGLPMTWYELEREAADGSTERELRDGDGQVLSWSLGAIELRREPEKLARQLDAPVDLDLLGTVKADGAIGDPRSVARLTAVARGRGVEALVGGPGQTVERLADGSLRLEISPAAIQPIADAATVTRSLRATLRFPADHPEVRALAVEAAGGSAEPRARARRLLSFVAGYVEDSSTDKDHPSVLQVIERRSGDCSDHALLYTTLARALGIPARSVMGLVWLGDDARAFGPHEWCEIVLDGAWIPVDPTWDQMPADAARLRLGPEAAAGAAVGGFEVEVLDVERR